MFCIISSTPDKKNNGPLSTDYYISDSFQLNRSEWKMQQLTKGRVHRALSFRIFVSISQCQCRLIFSHLNFFPYAKTNNWIDFIFRFNNFVEKTWIVFLFIYHEGYFPAIKLKIREKYLNTMNSGLNKIIITI